GTDVGVHQHEAVGLRERGEQMSGRTLGTTESTDQVLPRVRVAHELSPQVAASALDGGDRSDRARLHRATHGLPLAQRDPDEGADHDLEDDQGTHRIRRQEEGRHLVATEPPEALDRTRMHGHAVDLDLSELLHDLTDASGRLAPGGAGDHHELTADQLPLEHLAQPGGFGTRDAHAVDIGPGVAAGGGEVIRVHVVDLAGAGAAVHVDELVAHRDDRHPWLGVDEHLGAPDRGEQSYLGGTDDASGAYGHITRLDVVAH